MYGTNTIASLGAMRQQGRISHMISNNLSNVMTAGFKRDVPLFQGMLSQASGRLFVQETDGTKVLFSQGNLQNTGNPLDVAIEGEGFFKIQTPNGIRYTRAGNFKLTKEKKLVNASGYPVLGKKGEISLTGNTITIGKDGTVSFDGNPVDQIAPVTFRDLTLLRKEGHTLFQGDPSQQEVASERFEVLQGTLEASNVNPVEEMINLLDSFRSYEACIKVMQSHDNMDNKAVNDVGRV